MKALSIKQPWASLIAHGIKDIENRTWKTKFRGRIYIHASGQFAFRDFSDGLNETQLDLAKKLNCVLHTSAIIGEVDIVDCVINHPSIWAEKFTKTTCCPECGCKEVVNVNLVKEGYRECRSCGQEWWTDINYGKPIYNWVLANPVLYDKPILNVKGKLSFWEWNSCEQTCESCEKDFDLETMQRDGDDNYFCKQCADELFPIMQKEYEEMVAKGEIDPEDY